MTFCQFDRLHGYNLSFCWQTTNVCICSELNHVRVNKKLLKLNSTHGNKVWVHSHTCVQYVHAYMHIYIHIYVYTHSFYMWVTSFNMNVTRKSMLTFIRILPTVKLQYICANVLTVTVWLNNLACYGFLLFSHSLISCVCSLMPPCSVVCVPFLLLEAGESCCWHVESSR